MTALNWEKDRARRLPKEHSFDDLPPVGSYQDQVRCGVYPWSGSSRENCPNSASLPKVKNRAHDFDQLNRYVRHALHADFNRRTNSQKIETIHIIQKLIRRCQDWGSNVPQNELAYLDNACSLISKLTH